MIFMVEKSVRRGMCHFIYRCAKANNKYMKDYDQKIKNCHIVNSGMQIIYLVEPCHKSFQLIILSGSKVLLN